jgi:hypothetical protein
MIAQSFPERIQVRINVLVTEGMKRRNAAWLALMEDWERQEQVIDAALALEQCPFCPLGKGRGGHFNDCPLAAVALQEKES